MKIDRSEIIPGVWFSAVTHPVMTACLSIQLLTQLEREHAGMNALIPTVLSFGTSRFDTEEKLLSRLEAIGRVTLSPVVRYIGELQCPGLRAVWPCPDPEQDSVMPEAAALLCEAFISPATKGGLFFPANVEKACWMAESTADEDPPLLTYVRNRCIEEMCCFEDYPAQLPGISEVVCNYKKLSKYYRALLQTSPIEILYIGPAPAKKVRSELKAALSAMPRGEIDYEIGTDIRMNALEENCRTTEEAGNIPASALGFRFGELTEETDIPAALVFSRYLEAELKSSLPEECSVFCDLHKCILIVTAQLDSLSLVSTVQSVLSGLEDGSINEETLTTARTVGLDLPVSSETLEDYTLQRLLAGPDCSPAEMEELCGQVSSAALSRIAAGMEADQLFTITVS